MTGIEFLAQCAWRGTIVLAAAFTAVAALRRASSALRHFVWTAAFACLLLLPAFLLVAPKWGVRSPAAVRNVTVANALPPSGAGAAATPRRNHDPRPGPWMLALWMAGCAAAAVRSLVGNVQTSGMVRRAKDVQPAGRVRIVESAEAQMPMAWGILRPVVILPLGAQTWPEARLRTVLLHELVHVERRDLLAQAVGQVACCLYWFHPLTPLAAWQLRKERERACDDAVLLRGIAAHDYAGHLMDLVRVATGQNRWADAADAPAMAASDLESRVRAMLDSGRNRRPLSRRAALAVACAGIAVLLPAAAITARAQTQASRNAVEGVVQDPNGARVPGCRVSARNLDGSNQETTGCDAAGQFHFGSIPAGHYALEVRAPGFAVAKQDALVVAGASAQAVINLSIGAIAESVTVTGAKPALAAPPAPASPAPQRIRVGGMVQASRILVHTAPVYPPDLRQMGVHGTVILRAVVSKTGDLLNLEVINTDVNPGLAAAALDAVRHWRYQPTLLNGEPVEVQTSVEVRFELQ